MFSDMFVRFFTKKGGSPQPMMKLSHSAMGQPSPLSPKKQGHQRPDHHPLSWTHVPPPSTLKHNSYEGRSRYTLGKGRPFMTLFFDKTFSPISVGPLNYA